MGQSERVAIEEADHAFTFIAKTAALPIPARCSGNCVAGICAILEAKVCRQAATLHSPLSPEWGLIAPKPKIAGAIGCEILDLNTIEIARRSVGYAGAGILRIDILQEPDSFFGIFVAGKIVLPRLWCSFWHTCGQNEGGDKDKPFQ